MTGRFTGRVAVVTGGASGIGEATVRRLVEEGATVVVADVQDTLGEALAKELDGSVRYVRTDVSSESDVSAAVDLAVDWAGGLDIMFNNAGILGAVGPVSTMAVEEFSYTMAVDLHGVFLGTKHAARVMERQGTGSIIATASPAGLVGGLGPHAYSAAKAGVIGFCRSVAAELRPKGIRVNVIVPGAVVSPMTAAARTGDPNAINEAYDALSETALMTRPGLPDDIAAAVAYLASDDAAFVTGSVLTVDGGLVGAPGSSPYATVRPGLLPEGGRAGAGGATDPPAEEGITPDAR